MLLAAGYAPAIALLAVVVLSLAIGLLHGLLITRLRLQPFVVTLCGLLFYRGCPLADPRPSAGLARPTRACANWRLARSRWAVAALPIPFFLLLIVGVLAGTIWGRYLLALGRNETAARYSGIQIERMKVLAYVLAQAPLA